MNQILVTEKLYITPEFKRKRMLYKIEFFLSVFLVFALFSYYVYAELHDIRTNKIVWMAENDSIKKVIKRQKAKL